MKLFEFLRRFDIYGIPLEVNLKGKTRVTNLLGGVLSICAFSLIFAYGCILFNRLANRLSPVVTTF